MLILAKAQALTTESQLCQKTLAPLWKLDRIPLTQGLPSLTVIKNQSTREDANAPRNHLPEQEKGLGKSRTLWGQTYLKCKPSGSLATETKKIPLGTLCTREQPNGVRKGAAAWLLSLLRLLL